MTATQSAALSASHRVEANSFGVVPEAARTIDTIDVYDNPADAWPAWSELEAVAPASAYQTRKWLLPWVETIGRGSGIRPMFAVARGADGAPAALFPFGVAQHGAVRVAQFLGGRDSNSNLALIRPGFRFDRSEIMALLHRCARTARLQPDAFMLLNQPMTWEGISNPLALLPRWQSAASCYSASLAANGTRSVDERLSSEARHKLRKKRKKLAEFGPVSHIVASSATEVARMLDAFLAQKLQRFRDKHITSQFELPQTREFLLRAGLDSLASGQPAVEFHALVAGDRIVAVYAGCVHRGRFHAMINSFDMEPQIARTSPGDLLLLSMMQMMCDRGYQVFDLGIGEARYKSTWCDRTEPLFDVLYGITPRGRAYVYGLVSLRQLKACVKRNKLLFALARKLMRPT